MPADLSAAGDLRVGIVPGMSLAAPADLLWVCAGGVLCARAWVVLGVPGAWWCVCCGGFGLGFGGWSRCPELGL